MNQIKAAHLQLKIESNQSGRYFLVDKEWVDHILNKGFDFVLFVDLFVVAENGKPNAYKPITWVVQKSEEPFASRGECLTKWLETRIGQPDPAKKSNFWFTNIRGKTDCSGELRNFFIRSGVEVADLDLREARNTDNINGILAKMGY